MSIKDQAQRLQALEASSSFIVQAPAGSGKTELLTQRFLALLAIVRFVPEEIVAITFTRKAATEMRARIFEALHYASASNGPPQQPHALQTWQLAKKVLERDQKAKWNLLQNPNRLRILTIDALSAGIAKSAPLVSHFGSISKVLDDPQQIYIEAAQRLLTSLDSLGSWTQALETLLLHLDNNYTLAESLFVGMLSHRDQWLPHVVSHRGKEDSRAILEAGLKNAIQDTLQKANALFTVENKTELLSLACFAGNMLPEDKESAIAKCKNLVEFPEPTLPNLEAWLGLAELLLTKNFDWRRMVNNNCGFPPASQAQNQEEEVLFKNMKERMTQFLVKQSQNERLRLILKSILQLPPPSYFENQWRIVNALIELLPILVAQLNVIFREYNVTDFIAITEGAIAALGDADNPSDLALNLDYQIQHLLVDEFQDTSVTQYRLLELLTAGWENDDGRTLFLVGDPMQSIYRFREAEVGIFLKVKKFGIGSIHLIPLTLEVNFRSHAPIVNWFNKTFNTIFPSLENIELGAIPFSPSVALLEEELGSEVAIHPFFDPDEDETAIHVTQLIKNEIDQDSQKSVAILVRSRSHLQTIIPELKKAKIDFQAVEIENLIYSPAVQDLFLLTRALSHIGDRVAWLAILRAPWCGLTLFDLYTLANFDRTTTIWENLKRSAQIDDLSVAGKQRIGRIMPILIQALNERSRQTLRKYISEVWYKLGGPACLEEEHEIKNIDSYLHLLENFTDLTMIDFKLLQRRLACTFSHTASPNAKIHLMTIHKAKGLEFDVVIIPGLEKKPAVDENRLLLWLERQNNQGTTDLILAPVRSLEDNCDPIYRYIRTQNSLKAQYEIARLLYVAITRAKKKLHLVGSVYSVDKEKNGIKEPQVGSFLHLLWPTINNYFVEQNKPSKLLSPLYTKEVSSTLKRLTLDWNLPDILPAAPSHSQSSTHNHWQWSPDYLNHVGTVIHQLLQTASKNNWIVNNNYCLQEELLVCQKKLLQLSVHEEHLSHCLELIHKAMTTTLQDQRGRWILSNTHQEARSEYSIRTCLDANNESFIIDRTFVDDNNIRWIIDYKNTEHIGEEEASFLAQAKMRYAPQLENYAKVMQQIDPRPIRLGLYFPLFAGWCEWDYEEK